MLVAEGGGTGLTVMPVFHSLAQARGRWGDGAATAMWDASITKIVLGGATDTRHLQDMSTLIGERDETTDAVTIGERGLRSNQRSIRRVPIMMKVEDIRTLPQGTSLVLLRSAPSHHHVNAQSARRRDAARPVRPSRGDHAAKPIRGGIGTYSVSLMMTSSPSSGW